LQQHKLRNLWCETTRRAVSCCIQWSSGRSTNTCRC